MRKMIVAYVIMALAVVCESAVAAVPQTMSYQGVLKDAVGDFVPDGVYSLTFRIYDVASGGEALWTETQDVTVADGIFNAILGSLTPLSLAFDAQYWLGVSVGGDPELAPRVQLTAAPYAHRAQVVDTGGADDDWVISGEDVYRLTGSVGIGSASPLDGTLDVDSHALRGGDFTSDYPSLNTHVLHAEYTGSGNYNAVAVYGKSEPAEGYGYAGKFEASYVGVSASVAPTGDGWYYGVAGYVDGGAGTNLAVDGRASGGGTCYGVYGQANGSGTNRGVYGSAWGGVVNYGGYFWGNVMVTGTLSKGGGSFKIDHPLDPENKYLYHSFVESPDMMNIYNGNVVLDANGEARIQMPEWFDALNRDFRYQLTAIGAPGPNLYVLQKISGNEFTIAGGEAGMEVSWQVTGIRQDPFANAHRIPVEEDKPANERGKYLQPDAYGLPETRSVSYVEEGPRRQPAGQYQDSRARHPIAGAESDGTE